jgi:hypothetical protein
LASVANAVPRFFLGVVPSPGPPWLRAALALESPGSTPST